MKYKVVGWLDIVFGSLGFIQQIIFLLFVYPKLSSLYQDFGAQLPWYTRAYPYLVLIVAIILAGIVFIGSKLAFSKSPNEKLFKVGIVTLITIVLLGGIYLSLSLFSALSPIYGLSSDSNYLLRP